jgi:methanogenic corrinoid protein MtbC1
MRRASDNGASALARRFGDALRVADGAVAEEVVEEALGLGIAPEVVQCSVIAPALVRIGELWERRVLGVADEHLATAISERALRPLFQAMSANRAGTRTRERVMLAAVEDQDHVLGLRMVADVLGAAGFDVDNLGADVPVERLRAFLADHKPAVVGFSYGIANGVRSLARSIQAVHELAPDARIMLGGRAVPPGLWDGGYPRVSSTVDVIAVVEDLIAGPPQRPLPLVDLLAR